MHRSELNLSGIWVPLVTPFEGGAVDHAGLRRIVVRCAGAGVAGFVACGSTGEPWALDDTEQQAVLQTVLETAGGVPVLMGLAGKLAGRAAALVQPPGRCFFAADRAVRHSAAYRRAHR